jgi:uncharacterized lipoprotein YmbA
LPVIATSGVSGAGRYEAPSRAGVAALPVIVARGVSGAGRYKAPSRAAVAALPVIAARGVSGVGRVNAASCVALAGLPVTAGRGVSGVARVNAAIRVAVASLPAFAASVLVSACSSSPPTRFYTLSDTAPEATPPPTGIGWVRIVGVTIPGEIDRPELVRRVGPNQLSIAGLDRWAAPLDQTIRRALSDDISRRVPNPSSGQQYSVSVDVHEFYGDGSCNVTLRAAWTLKQSSAGNAQPVNEEIQVPSSGACTATLPATMSIALGQLSDRIIAGVARIPTPAPAPSSGAAPAH